MLFLLAQIEHLGHWTHCKKPQPSTKQGSWKNQEKLPEIGHFLQKMFFDYFFFAVFPDFFKNGAV